MHRRDFQTEGMELALFHNVYITYIPCVTIQTPATRHTKYTILNKVLCVHLTSYYDEVFSYAPFTLNVLSSMYQGSLFSN